MQNTFLYSVISLASIVISIWLLVSGRRIIKAKYTDEWSHSPKGFIITEGKDAVILGIGRVILGSIILLIATSYLLHTLFPVIPLLF